MTADHAGQTGGELPPVPYDQHEREMLHLIGERDHLEDMADRLAAAIAPADVLGEHSSDNNPWLNALDYAEANGTHPDAPSRPAPVPGQAARERDTAAPGRDTTVPLAAREAAVEAVARELGRHQGLRGPMDDDRPDVWQNRCECGWDDGDEHPGWRERYRLHVAVATLSLPEVAALSAAPGQDEWVRCSCGRAVPCRHCDTDGQEQP